MKVLAINLEHCKKKQKFWDISEKNLSYLIWRICLQYFLQDYTLQISICEHKKQIWVSVGQKVFKVCNGPYIKYVGEWGEFLCGTWKILSIY